MGDARRAAAPDFRLVPLARAQHGPFTRQQAIEAGCSPSTIKRRLASGRWVRLYRGVYCAATVPDSLERTVSAAVLACGCGAAASHRTAARLWDLDVPAPDQPEVTVPLPSKAHPPGIRVHGTGRLSRSEAASRDGIRITSPMRTLLDLAQTSEAPLLELALDRLWRQGRLHPARLAEYLDDDWARSKRGTRALRKLVHERLGQGASGSDLETLLLQAIRESGLPLPVRQHPVVTPFGVRYLDLAYPALKIAIEIDGMGSRLDPEVFLDDRVRQNLIEAQGWTFRRFGRTHITREPLWATFTLGEALGLRPVRWVRR